MGAVGASGMASSLSGQGDGLPGILGALAGALTSLLGGPFADQSPASMIGLGFGLIGLRDALVRDRDEADERHAEVAEMMAGQAYFVSGEAGDDLFGYDVDPPPGAPPAVDPDEEMPPGVIDPFAPGGSRS